MLSSVAMLSAVLALAPAIVAAWGWPPSVGARTSIFESALQPTDGASSQPPGRTILGGGTAVIGGSLDKEIIRRSIRPHIDEVKGCYEPSLARQPDLTGSIWVKFTINQDGKVVSSVLEKSTMHAPGVERCIVDAVRTWEFPKPKGGGVVIVSYPFKLTPGEEPPPPPGAPSKP